MVCTAWFWNLLPLIYCFWDHTVLFITANYHLFIIILWNSYFLMDVINCPCKLTQKTALQLITNLNTTTRAPVKSLRLSHLQPVYGKFFWGGEGGNPMAPPLPQINPWTGYHVYQDIWSKENWTNTGCADRARAWNGWSCVLVGVQYDCHSGPTELCI